MKQQQPKGSMQKYFIRTLLITAFILLIPLVAMQFSDEVAWDLADFIIMGTLLISTGFVYGLIASRLASATHRVILGVIFAAVVLLIWVEVAMSIFD